MIPGAADWPRWLQLWGEGLLRASWQGGLAIAAACALGSLFPRMPAAVRCWLWRLAYLKLLLAFLVPAPIYLPLLPAGLTPAPAGSFYAEGAPAEAVQSPAPGHSEAAPGGPAPQKGAPPVPPWPGILLFTAWAGGVAWCVARLGREWVQARKLHRGCVEAADPGLEERCAELAFLLGLKRVPRILLAQGRGSPLLVGSRGPTVLLPASVLRDYTPEQLELMLAHELAHLKRGDLVWSWVPAVAHWLFFFHPLVWLANREWRIAQEMACDELAMEATSARAAEYGEVLVRVAAQSRLNLQAGLATVGLEESPDTLKRRLAAMQHPSRFSPSRVAALSLPAAVLIGAGLLPWRIGGRSDAAAAALEAPLRYGWQPGRAYTYAVTIEADYEEIQERHTGHFTYQPLASDGGFTLSQSGSLFPSRVAKTPAEPGRFALPGFPRIPFLSFPREGALIRIDPTGRIYEQRGETALPHFLGSAARVAIEPLPPARDGVWKVEGDREIVVEEPDDRSPGGPALPFARAPRTARISGRERATYSVERVLADSVEIRKQYQLRSTEVVDGSPRLSLSGEARLRWDRKQGVVRSMEFRGMLTRTERHVTRRTPLLLRSVLQEAPPAPAAPPSEAPGGPSAAAAEAESVPELTADLLSGDSTRRQLAASKLAQLAPSGNRASVAAALKKVLDDEQELARLFAARALKTWGGRSDSSAVEPLLKDASPAVRWTAIETVGALGAPGGLEALARMVEEDRDRLFAARALREAGSAAEEPAVSLLKSESETVRREACGILEAAGTPASLPRLAALAKDKNPLVRTAAEAAAAAIRRRHPAP